MTELDMSCRCTGIRNEYNEPRNCRCDQEADGEDGLCKDCRVGDGRCCEDFNSGDAHMLACMQVLEGQMRVYGNGESHTMQLGYIESGKIDP